MNHISMSINWLLLEKYDMKEDENLTGNVRFTIDLTFVN